MKFRVLVREVPAEDGGGFWAEVPALPGCVTQGDTRDELESNPKEAITGWLESQSEDEPIFLRLLA